MPNITCITCDKGAYESGNDIICINCNQPEKNCKCKKSGNKEKKDIIIQIKRHLKGIEKAVKELEK
jgi:hypothetical protein